MKYFAGYLIEGEAGGYYKKVTADLSSHFGIKDLSKHIPPHLTLKPPFETEDITPFEKIIEGLVEKEEVLPFSIDEYGRFNLESETIFLSVQQQQNLQEKAEKILSTLADFGNNQKPVHLPLKLHASIARHLTPHKSQEIWEYVSSLPVPHFDLQFDNLTLFVFQNDNWEVRKIYRFIK